MSTAIKPIRTEEDHKRALARIDEIFDAEEGTPESDELDVLVDLVCYYESQNVDIGFPDPISAIEFRMDQAGLSQRDLVPFIGSPAKVSEVLSGKRDLTMSMARALHEHLGIPADCAFAETRRGIRCCARRNRAEPLSSQGDGKARMDSPDSRPYRSR